MHTHNPNPPRCHMLTYLLMLKFWGKESSYAVSLSTIEKSACGFLTAARNRK